MAKYVHTTLLVFISIFTCLSSQAQHTQFQAGDIFLGQGGGIIQWRDSNAVLIRNINTGDGGGNGNGTGLRIHPITGQLWVANSNLPPNSTNGIRIINKDGTPGNTIDVSAYQKTPTSITFDKQGNAYVGGLWNDSGDEIVKINPTGTAILDHYPVSSDNFVWGPEHVEMDCNDSIIYYTNLRERVKRYNVVTHQQLPNFADLTGSVSWLFGMRLLPDNTILVVTADHVIFRLNASGTIIQTYTPTNLASFFGISCTPDGKSFWSGALSTDGRMYKFDIATGNVQNFFLAGRSIQGIAIYGDQVKNCKIPVPAPVLDNNTMKCFNIYPNPNNGSFTLQADLNGKVIVRVFNALGQYVFNKEVNLSGLNNKIPFNVENLASGVYLVQVINNNGICSQKTMINH